MNVGIEVPAEYQGGTIMANSVNKELKGIVSTEPCLEINEICENMQIVCEQLRLGPKAKVIGCEIYINGKHQACFGNGNDCAIVISTGRPMLRGCVIEANCEHVCSVTATNPGGQYWHRQSHIYLKDCLIRCKGD